MNRRVIFVFCLAGALFSQGVVLAAGDPHIAVVTIDNVSAASITAGQSVTIAITAWAAGGYVANQVDISLGDGGLMHIACDSSGTMCSGTTQPYAYNTPGDFTISATICVVFSTMPTQQQCFTDTATIHVDPAVGPPPVCTPDGCNAHCPGNCTVAEDPDCGCQAGNNCCGIGCDNANDSDCPTAPPIADSYNNPLLSNNIVEFIWRTIIVLFTASLVIVPLMILIGAYVLVTSGGLPARIDLGKKIIIWTLIGFVVILLARGALNLVWRVLGG